MRILVTGGAGFIGRPLADSLRSAGHDVVTADVVDQRAGDGGEHRVIDITVADQVESLLQDVRPETIVHAAAIVGVAASVGAGLSPTVQVNIAGSVHLFEAAIAVGGVRRIIDLSSEEYYGDFATDPITETAPGVPISPYGISKHAVERLGGYYAEVAGLPYVAARLCWVYGPDFPRTRLPQPWLEDVAAGRSSVLERGGDQRLDLTHLDDVLHGIRLLVEADSLRHRAYNVATGTAVTVREVAEALHEIRPEWHAEVGAGGLELAPGVRAAHKGAYDITRMRDELGYRPRVTLHEGLRSCLERIEQEAIA